MGTGAWFPAVALGACEGTAALVPAWDSELVWPADTGVTSGACVSALCVDMGAPQVVQNLQVSGTNAPHSVQYIVFLSIGFAYGRRVNRFLGDSLVESVVMGAGEDVIVRKGGIGGLHRCGCGH